MLVVSRALIVIVVAGAFLATRSSGEMRVAPVKLTGIVAGSYFAPPASGTKSSTLASNYEGVKVCVDSNNDGVCGFGETSATTGRNGTFAIVGVVPGPIVAEVSTASMNAGHRVTRRVVFRVSKDQVSEDVAVGRPVVVTPISTEVVRMMESGNLAFKTARADLAARLNVSAEQLMSDLNRLENRTVQGALLTESVILTNRFTLAAAMFDRHDSTAATMKEAYQASMNLEGIPRYDHLFIIMLENKATSSIRNSAFAPRINDYLNSGNQFTSYYASGNPSEPNYIALAAADDFGITDDENWNCMPEDDIADQPDDPLPAGMVPCVNSTNHNLKNRANLFSAMSAAGMTWRVYSESRKPGQDWRLKGIADPALVAPDHVYLASSPVGAIGDPNLQLPFPAALYATKHNPAVAFQDVRSAFDSATNNRTLGGGQWDEAIKKSPATPEDWDIDQFGSDLRQGDVGNLNFLVPDQCDDMHGVKWTGAIAGSDATPSASDCSGNAIIYRGDQFVDGLIRKIQGSAVWTNTRQRAAIVVMFDEGNATTGFNSCCGWNPSAGQSIAGKSLGVLLRNSDGMVSVDTTIARYGQGNKGHGTSVFGILTNQPKAPKGIVDSDAYNHFAFVRTLQDMFQLADPGDDWSYMNRSRYTEKFIAAHLLSLPEYADSADPHFDAVRPMNHAYVIPSGYLQKNGFPAPQTGPDSNQINVWAIR